MPNIKTSDYHIIKGSNPLTVVYRIHYKLMKTKLEPHALINFFFLDKKLHFITQYTKNSPT